jgi:hypothetical protein
MLKTNTWHKSTRSGAAGHCVEVFWKKSSRSNPSGNCLEAKADGSDILVRDTKLGEASPVLRFTTYDWGRFVNEIKDGFTCPQGGEIETWNENGGVIMLDRSEPKIRLTFTRAEWNAFTEGVDIGEFDLQPA